ncbi:hypothetical protein COT79_01720 [Candidatus Berkelbacteria bacterium CG10_big_fil_rev_8_21_14_0_10_43_14]|uniref:Uncharacterized protein n=1 Tax=Candidatus Berkelbacteria bacterium CG10_big_fil_rev_8_21_14_0_10_43_14 TaxID=1974515 RepID=A0A2M6RAB3_9BACT|nr:MAG: hypothetical protein COT79_01720 [Candidatus Berkelbacteria bacterium CG10_big_fil_rev_8_21_14_0_10_43_14]
MKAVVGVMIALAIGLGGTAVSLLYKPIVDINWLVVCSVMTGYCLASAFWLLILSKERTDATKMTRTLRKRIGELVKLKDGLEKQKAICVGALKHIRLHSHGARP